jgi:hypothetical protein
MHRKRSIGGKAKVEDWRRELEVELEVERST